ncbi:MAG: helix-turn-helix transcriptional regulator, partial [Caldimonas sp.]
LTEGGATQLLVSFVNEGQDVGHIPADALRALFDFTNAEANLASALVSGVTVEQYAQSRGVTIGTVRTQLNQVLSKSGAHRQADLVRRVLCSAAAALPAESSGLAPAIA